MTGSATHKPGAPWPSAALTAAFGLLAALGLAHHEMWRDELHEWLMATESPGLADIWRNMGTEGHPALWYLILWALSNVSTDAALMQGFNWCCGVGAVWLLARHAPLGWPAKVLLATGYFFLFEYTLISRVYALELLLLLGALVLATRPPTKANGWALGLVLLLLSFTVIHGAIIAGVISLYLLLRHRRWAPALMGSAGALLSAVQVWSQTVRIGYMADRYYAGPVHDLAWAAKVFTSFLNGVMPLPRMGTDHFWNTHLLRPDAVGPLTWAGVLLTAGLLACVVVALWRDKALLACWLLAVLALYFISGYLFEGFTRHHSHFLLVSLAALWLVRGGGRLPRLQEGVLATVLGVSWVAGGYAYLQDWNRPFTNAGPAAEFLMATPLKDAQWASSMDFCATPVAYHGERRIFSAQSAGPVSWIWWAENDWDRKVTQPQAMVRFDSLATATGQPVAVILSLPANFKLDAGNHMHLFPGASGSQLDRVFFLQSIEGAIVEDENYLLYAIGDFEGNTWPSLLSQLVGRRGLHDLPDTTDNVKHHFDQVVVNDTAVVLSGWGILADGGDSLARPSVVLRGEKHGYVMPAVRHFRRDVRDAFPGECDTDSAGFHLVVPRSWIAPGKYSVGAYLINDKLQQGLVVRDSLVL